MIEYPELKEVAYLMRRKGLKPVSIAKGTGQSTQTVYEYFNGGNSRQETVKKIINYINSYDNQSK